MRSEAKLNRRSSRLAFELRRKKSGNINVTSGMDVPFSLRPEQIGKQEGVPLEKGDQFLPVHVKILQLLI
jgi:hypothetical protein